MIDQLRAASAIPGDMLRIYSVYYTNIVSNGDTLSEYSHS